MGEFVEFGPNPQAISWISGIASLVALGLFALLQTDPSDDDDSNGGGGGGLMQPIA